jgi:hypothetical protein
MALMTRAREQQVVPKQSNRANKPGHAARLVAFDLAGAVSFREKVLPAGYWWLVCSDKKYCWLVAVGRVFYPDRPDRTGEVRYRFKN